jgi:hypothetical protein
MAGFSPQRFDTGPLFPISSSIVARLHPVAVAPHSSIWKKMVSVATVPVVLTGPSIHCEKNGPITDRFIAYDAEEPVLR